jgi:thioredoxin 1
MNITLIVLGVFMATAIVMVFVAKWKMKNIPSVANNPKIKVLTDKNFNQQIKKGIILVDFWAEWCGPCKMMAPVLNDLAENLDSGKSIGKLDVQEFQSLASTYKVRGIPTMILFKDGKEVNRFVGVKSKDFLLKEMNKFN